MMQLESIWIPYCPTNHYDDDDRLSDTMVTEITIWNNN